MEFQNLYLSDDMAMTLKCEKKVDMAGKYFVNAETDEVRNIVRLPLKAFVQYGPSRTPLDRFLLVRYVKLKNSITQPCGLAKGPLQDLDYYLQQWSQNFVQGRKGLDAAAAVGIYLSDLKSQIASKEPHLIFYPEACEVHFTQLAKKFGGEFDSKQFRHDLKESITAALVKELQEQSSHPISPDDKIRLVRAENLAKAWLEPDHLVRKDLEAILDKL